MPIRFDCEDEPNEFMEMPCKCDCGKWFELSDGYRDGKNIVCRECAYKIKVEPDEEPGYFDNDEDDEY